MADKMQLHPIWCHRRAEEEKYNCESSLFKELGCHTLQTLKFPLYSYVPSRVYSRMAFSKYDCLDQVEIQHLRTFKGILVSYADMHFLKYSNFYYYYNTKIIWCYNSRRAESTSLNIVHAAQAGGDVCMLTSPPAWAACMMFSTNFANARVLSFDP